MRNATLPDAAVKDGLSTFVSMKPLGTFNEKSGARSADVFDETSGRFAAKNFVFLRR